MDHEYPLEEDTGTHYSILNMENLMDRSLVGYNLQQFIGLQIVRHD